MKTESVIRGSEFVVALASTYMAVVTMVQTSLYWRARPYIAVVLGPIASSLGGSPTGEGGSTLDLIIIGMALALSFTFWRKGDESGFGRLFSLNMLMFFPSVLDFSQFNWINLILPYESITAVTVHWVFGVGLLLQATYLTLRYTVRFREMRAELEERGAEEDDIDEVSRGQMVYLGQLVAGTVAISVGVYFGYPSVSRFLDVEATGLPYPQLIIGVVFTLLIAAGTILYLRGGGSQVGAVDVAPETVKGV
jgi:hypothetical protein